MRWSCVKSLNKTLFAHQTPTRSGIAEYRQPSPSINNVSIRQDRANCLTRQVNTFNDPVIEATLHVDMNMLVLISFNCRTALRAVKETLLLLTPKYQIIFVKPYFDRLEHFPRNGQLMQRVYWIRDKEEYRRRIEGNSIGREKSNRKMEKDIRDSRRIGTVRRLKWNS